MSRPSIVDLYFREEFANFGIDISFLHTAITDEERIPRQSACEKRCSAGAVDAKLVCDAAEFTAAEYIPTTVAEAYFTAEFKRLNASSSPSAHALSVEAAEFVPSPLYSAWRVPCEWQQFMGQRRSKSVSELVLEGTYVREILGQSARDCMECIDSEDHLLFTSEAYLVRPRHITHH